MKKTLEQLETENKIQRKIIRETCSAATTAQIGFYQMTLERIIETPRDAYQIAMTALGYMSKSRSKRKVPEKKRKRRNAVKSTALDI